jgi:hypothetical protein
LRVLRRQQDAPLDRPEHSPTHCSLDRRYRLRNQCSGRVKDSTGGCVGIKNAIEDEAAKTKH